MIKKFNWKKSLLIFSIIFVGTVAGVFLKNHETFATGNTYYVQNGGSGDCSVGNPCDSLVTAQSTASAGDTIILMADAGTEAATFTTPWDFYFNKSDLTWQAEESKNITLVKGAGAAIYVGSSSNATDNVVFNNLIIDGQSNSDVIRIYSGDGFLTTNIHFNNCSIQNTTSTYGIRGISGTSDNNSMFFNNCDISINTSSSSILKPDATNTSWSFVDSDIIANSQIEFYRSDNVNSDANISFSGGSIDFTSAGATRALFSVSSNSDLTVNNVDFTVRSNSPVIQETSAGKTGTIDFQNNIVTYTTGVNKVLYINSGTHAITIDGNTFNCPFDPVVLVPSTILYIVDQANYNITDNTFDTHSETNTSAEYEHIYITSTGTPAENSLISGNKHYSKAKIGYILAVSGDNSPTEEISAKNMFDGLVIEKNIYLGPLYWDSSGSYGGGETLHTVFLGYSKKIHFRNNYVCGGYYGIVVKTDSQDYENMGGVYGNIFVNNYYLGVLIKGVRNVPIFNNTFYLSANMTMKDSFVKVHQNTTSDYPSNGTKVYNNVFYGQQKENALNPRYDININDINSPADEDYSFYSNNNFFYNPNNADLTFRYLDKEKTFSQWQDLNFDENSQNEDPAFNDISDIIPDSGDLSNFSTNLSQLQLLSASPAINAGEALISNTDYNGAVSYTDYFNQSIPQYPNPTIGAIEYIDTTAPESSHSISGTEGSNGYYKTSSPTVSLLATDNITNLQTNTILYHLDSNEDSTYSSAVTIPEGEHILYYKAKDYKNNTESSYHSVSIKSDVTVPALSFTSPLTDSYTTTAESINISGTASDGLSGIASVSINGVSVSNEDNFDTLVNLEEGINSYLITVRDNAGNIYRKIISITRSASSSLDTTPPTITLTNPKYNPAYTKYNYVTVTGSATDDSGISTLMVNNVRMSDPSNFSLRVRTTSWKNQFSIIAVDNAGNSKLEVVTIYRASAYSDLATKSTILMSDGDSESLLSTTSVTSFSSRRPTFKGTTTPNSIVELEIHSKVINASVMSDSEGNWEYTPTEDLEEGDHTIKITIKDMLQNILEEQTYSFTIKAKASVSKQAEDKPLVQVTQVSQKTVNYVWLIAILFLLLVSGVYAIRMNNKRF